MKEAIVKTLDEDGFELTCNTLVFDDSENYGTIQEKCIEFALALGGAYIRITNNNPY